MKVITGLDQVVECRDDSLCKDSQPTQAVAGWHKSIILSLQLMYALAQHVGGGGLCPVSRKIKTSQEVV